MGCSSKIRKTPLQRKCRVETEPARQIKGGVMDKSDGVSMGLYEILGKLADNCYNEGQGKLDTTIAEEISKAEAAIRAEIAKELEVMRKDYKFNSAVEERERIIYNEALTDAQMIILKKGDE